MQKRATASNLGSPVSMLASQRKQEILDRVRRDGPGVAAVVAVELNVSEDTIRRDLRELAAHGHVQRVRGGAIQVSPAAANYAARTTVAAVVKVQVAHAAVGLIKPGQTVFLDGGTTAAAICGALPDTLDITVVTHSPTVAVELVDRQRVRVIPVGATLYRHSLVTVGALASEYINGLTLDLFLMGSEACTQSTA